MGHVHWLLGDECDAEAREGVREPDAENHAWLSIRNHILSC
jgi:hypothetical protein